jgi:16S rRNA (cytidine1402-2'-O)-methyltransferase
VTTGTLYLVPTGLGTSDVSAALPQRTHAVLCQLDYFVAENAKSARAFLKAAGHPRALQDLQIDVLDEHTPQARVAHLICPIEQGRDCGLMSEAGAPAVADPGAALVHSAHLAGIRVVPLVGPSALLLALMSSGLNGQRFSFHGYVPVQAAARSERLQALESASEREDATQIFIEAPYRNDALLAAIIESCRPDTLLCVATDLTLESESIAMRRVADWSDSRPTLNRRPSVFLLYRARADRQKR